MLHPHLLWLLWQGLEKSQDLHIVFYSVCECTLNLWLWMPSTISEPEILGISLFHESIFFRCIKHSFRVFHYLEKKVIHRIFKKQGFTKL